MLKPLLYLRKINFTMIYPKVSVVTITYGHEKHIAETIRGVLMQQYAGPIEFIIANDNSPDNTHDVVESYFHVSRPPANIEIKYTRHLVNKGIVPNWYWALKQCSGEYIAICEGDDYWTDPLKLKKQVDFLESNSDFSMVCHNAEIVYEGISKKPHRFNKRKSDAEISMKELLEEWVMPTASMVFRYKCIEDYPSWHKEIYSGDLTLALVAMNIGKNYYFNDTMSVYRINYRGSSASSIFRNRGTFIWEQHIKLLNYFNDYTDKKFELVINNRLGYLRREIDFYTYKNRSMICALINMPRLFFVKLFRRVVYKLKN